MQLKPLIFLSPFSSTQHSTEYAHPSFQAPYEHVSYPCLFLRYQPLFAHQNQTPSSAYHDLIDMAGS